MEEQSNNYTTPHGDKIWYLPSKGMNHYHRLDGPAVEIESGTKEWWVDGTRHRLDGPAIEYKSGSKHWYVDGRRHRIDGPAVEWSDGRKEWFVDGKELPTEEVEEWIEENAIDLSTEAGQMAFKLRWS